MPTIDEAAIQQLLGELSAAWSRGDANAFGARYRADGTFTNVNGTFHIGRDEFNQRHAEVFTGPFKGTTLGLKPRLSRFIRPDVAIIDVDVSLSGCRIKPPGIQADPDGTLHTCLLLVLVKEGGSWWIAAYHNVWGSAI